MDNLLLTFIFICQVLKIRVAILVFVLIKCHLLLPKFSIRRFSLYFIIYFIVTILIRDTVGICIPYIYLDLRDMAYFMGLVQDQRDDCRLVPNKEVNSVELAKINVELTKVDMAGDWQAQLEKLAKVYEMMYRDEVHISPSILPDYEKKLKIFFEEHMHKDPELRFIKAGSGFFDVRSESDEWIRIPVCSGDFIYLPAGIYHRFSPDWSEDIVAIRLFQSNPKWEAYGRSNNGEAQAERIEYLRSIGKM